MTFVLGLSALLVAYNALLNVLGLQERRLYVPANLVAGGLVLGAGRMAGLSWDEAGLAAGSWWWGLGVAALFGLAVEIALGTSPGRRLLADRRFEGVSGGALAYVVVVRIPLGTALFEELAFRGVLLGTWMLHQSTPAAVVGSSLVFGLWHVAPTLEAVRRNRLGGSPLLWVTAGVLGTALAGVLLAVLRLAGEGLGAPVLAHAGVNSLGALAAARALRRS